MNFTGRPMRNVLFTVVPLLLISLIDAAAGGGIRIVFSMDRHYEVFGGMVNAFYQFSLAAFALVIVFFVYKRSRLSALLLVLSYFFMVNETLYYFFQPMLSGFHDLVIVDGAGNPNFYFPSAIAGWLSWFCILIGEKVVPIPFWLVLAFNGFWIGMTAVLFFAEDIFTAAQNPDDYEKRLDQLFYDAMPINHPAVQDYHLFKAEMEINRLQIEALIVNASQKTKALAELRNIVDSPANEPPNV